MRQHFFMFSPIFNIFYRFKIAFPPPPIALVPVHQNVSGHSKRWQTAIILFLLILCCKPVVYYSLFAP